MKYWKRFKVKFADFCEWVKDQNAPLAFITSFMSLVVAIWAVVRTFPEASNIVMVVSNDVSFLASSGEGISPEKPKGINGLSIELYLSIMNIGGEPEIINEMYLDIWEKGNEASKLELEWVSVAEGELIMPILSNPSKKVKGVSYFGVSDIKNRFIPKLKEYNFRIRAYNVKGHEIPEMPTFSYTFVPRDTIGTWTSSTNRYDISLKR